MRSQPKLGRDAGARSIANGLGVLRRALAAKDQLLFSQTGLSDLPLAVDEHPEGDHVAPPHMWQLAHRPFDIARVVVAPANDDHVLDAAAHEETALGEVAEVPGVKPRRFARPVTRQSLVSRRRELRILEIARRHAWAAHDDLAHSTLGEALTG